MELIIKHHEPGGKLINETVIPDFIDTACFQVPHDWNIKPYDVLIIKQQYKYKHTRNTSTMKAYGPNIQNIPRILLEDLKK